MTVKKLESGYWHVRWHRNLWLQWPCWRGPVLSDGFGWITERHVREAERLVAQEAGDDTR